VHQNIAYFLPTTTISFIAKPFGYNSLS